MVVDRSARAQRRKPDLQLKIRDSCPLPLTPTLPAMGRAVSAAGRLAVAANKSEPPRVFPRRLALCHETCESSDVGSQNFRSQFQISDFKFQLLDFRSQISGSWFQILDLRFPFSGFRT